MAEDDRNISESLSFTSLLRKGKCMKLADTDGNGAAVSNTATTHLTGSWLIIARTVWLMLVVPGLGLFVASLPAFYQQLQRACGDPVTCNLYGSLTVQGLAALTTTGFSMSSYA